MNEYEYGQCLGCGQQLYWIDDDPNGEHNATCARCRAEDAHDFDADPEARFDRFDRYVDAA